MLSCRKVVSSDGVTLWERRFWLGIIGEKIGKKLLHRMFIYVNYN